jgi:transmembrane sensor
VIPMHPHSSSLRRILAITAIFLTIMGGAWIWWYNGRRQSLLSIKTEAATLTDTLPDGSMVTLNKYSALTYPRQFEGGQRLVKLEGEGFFHVAPDQDHPFQVQVNGVKVLVLGTSFNVRSKAGSTEVIVETGKVAVVSGEQKAVIEPGEQVAVSADHTRLVKTETAGELYQYYRTKKFVCHNTPLWKLAEVLNEAYDVRIAVQGQDVRNLELTTTFSNEPLDSILDVVTQTLNLHQARVGKNIILK